jgi:outer membrane lipoprotein-sorting protein
MKSRPPANPTKNRALARIGMALALPVLLLLEGCVLSHTRSVNKVTLITNVQNATLDQLLQQLSTDYNSVKSLTATVEITASVGSEHRGEIKDYPTFDGYIVMRKPSDLHIQMLLPVVRSRALEMVSNGTDFKLYIPPKDKAVTGKDEEPATASPNGLDNLRPYIIRDALVIPPLHAGEEVALVEDSRLIPSLPHQKGAFEEPDYDLTIFRHKTGQEVETLRVIHIGRVTLRPYEQDIYDHTGRIVTKVAYDGYKHFGDHVFPTTITISRPLDEYSLKIEFSKLIFNDDVDDDSFLLNIPESVPVQKMP